MKKKASEKRHDIMLKTIMLLSQGGIHNCSFRTLAKECKIVYSSIYHYFPNKMSLIEAVVDYIVQYCRERIFSHIYLKEHGQSKENDIFYECLNDYFIVDKTKHIVMMILALELRCNEQYKRIYRKINTYYEEWNLNLKRTLEPNSKQLMHFAQSCYSQLIGSFMLSCVNANTKEWCSWVSYSIQQFDNREEKQID